MNLKTFAILALSALGLFGLWRLHKNINPGSTESSASSDTLRVGTAADYPPFSFKEQGEITGFEVDVIKAVAAKAGKKLELFDLSFEMLLPEIQMGNIQAIAACLSKTEERERQVRFLSPHLVDTFVIVTKADQPRPTSLHDLVGKEVVVNDGYTSDTLVSKVSGIHLRRLPTVAEAILALESNIAQAFVTAKNPIMPVLVKDRAKYTITNIPAAPEELICIAVDRHEQELYEQLERAMSELKADGTLTAIAVKWGIV